MADYCSIPRRSTSLLHRPLSSATSHPAGIGESADSERDEEIKMEVEPRYRRSTRCTDRNEKLLCRVERLLMANPDDDIEVETRYHVTKFTFNRLN